MVLLDIGELIDVAFFASIFFHLFNSIVFQVGIFPYLSLAFAVFFFEPNVVRKLFLKNKPLFCGEKIEIPSYATGFKTVFAVYFLLQLALPLRHHFIQDNVLWTEEGHRLSWRMMLRTKSARTSFIIVDKATNVETKIKLKDYLTKKQIRIEIQT